MEEKKLQLDRDLFDEGKKMRNVDCEESLLRTCEKLSDDGFPDHAVFKCCPEFKAMMGEDEDHRDNSECKFKATKGRDEEESDDIEEA